MCESVYIHECVCVCVYIYIYIYIYTNQMFGNLFSSIFRPMASSCKKNSVITNWLKSRQLFPVRVSVQKPVIIS